MVNKLVSFGSPMESGKRVGAGAQIHVWGNPAVLRIAMGRYVQRSIDPRSCSWTRASSRSSRTTPTAPTRLQEVLGRMAAMGFSIPRRMKS